MIIRPEEDDLAIESFDMVELTPFVQGQRQLGSSDWRRGQRVGASA